jgi:hypothetical protein
VKAFSSYFESYSLIFVNFIPVLQKVVFRIHYSKNKQGGFPNIKKTRFFGSRPSRKSALLARGGQRRTGPPLTSSL